MFLQYYLNEQGDRVYTLKMTNTLDTESPSRNASRCS
ncbi:NOP10 isoform 2 [Pan troglodytes]|uniref:NOP10 ribonucleoprotein n=3 Tax=Hominidae TaxID=9604 RepID=H0YM60_HUMAN|nr:NOP10 isoform 2 [Pan troglodytes]PNJ08407.1 NOP10 isoform 2 [Pongo abelii]